MRLIERDIPIAFNHRVFFTRHVFGVKNALLAEILAPGGGNLPARSLVVIDEGLHRAQPGLSAQIERYFTNQSSRLELVSPPVILEGGERVKNSYFHVSEVQSHLERFHMDRHSYLLAVGGGALLDVVGLAAATAHRGMRHIRLPSTTLAQNDSGVGIKNGINAFGRKNFIGTFAVPFAVINDSALLDSLSPRDKRAGYSEAVKVACIRDSKFFEHLEANISRLRKFEPEPLEELIFRCAQLHVTHITEGGDPFEMGSARPLDFGHWAAHKLEQLSEYRIRHGEAVAIGMALDVVYSRRVGLLETSAAERILALIQGLGFQIFANELLHVGSHGELMILRGLDEFREHLGGRLSITLLKAIGEAVEVHEMKAATILESLNELKDRAKGER